MHHFHCSGKNEIHMYVGSRKQELCTFGDSAILLFYLKLTLYDIKVNGKIHVTNLKF